MYELKTKENRVNETGKEENLTLGYIVDAVTFGEAENKISQELDGGNFQVTQIKLSPYQEYLVEEDKYRFFKVVVTMTDINENSGKEKKVKVNYLVAADDQKEAVKEVEEFNRDTIVNWEVTALNETNIVGVL